ncbi:MAG: nitroreductase family protein [Pseudomonadota bacterium]
MSSFSQKKIAERFGDDPRWPDHLDDGLLQSMIERASCRDFSDEIPPDDLVKAIAAVALSSPSKSDLQQRDIIHVKDPNLRRQILDLIADQSWLAGVPCLLIFCGNNRRQRQIHNWRGHAFANDHLDAFF